MTTKKATPIAGNLITEQARAALANCKSLRSIHDTAKSLITNQQLGLDFDVKRNNVFQMPVGLITCDMSESIRSTLDEGAVRGFADAYLAGDHVEPLGVAAEDGNLRVVTGFARFAGLQLAIAEGADVQGVWVNQIEGGRASELVRQLVSNQQVEVSPLDLAAAYQELIEQHHFSVADVARAIHRKESHVRKMLDLASVAPGVKDMVEKGLASVSTALAADKQCKAAGVDTVVLLQEQLAKAHQNGSAKITAKAIGAPSALYGRKDLNVAAPVLAQLADQLEKAMPLMHNPASVKIELTLDGSQLNLQDVAKALANLRAAFITSTSGIAEAANA